MRPTLNADQLLKHNINALLQARGQTKPELARWCRRSRSWLDKIFSEDRREIPLKYLDRIADFFGIATYQLFQPGISPLMERRSGNDRRKLRDRRISNAVLSEKRGDADLMSVIRALSQQGREQAIAELMKILDRELRPPRATPASAGGQDHTPGTAAGVPPPSRATKRKNA